MQNDPDNLYWNVQKAMLLSSSGKSQEAVLYIEKIIEINPGDFSTMLLEYQILAKAGKSEEALSVLDKMKSNAAVQIGGGGSTATQLSTLIDLYRSFELYKLDRYQEANDALGQSGFQYQFLPGSPLWQGSPSAIYDNVFKGLILEKMGKGDAAPQFYKMIQETYAFSATNAYNQEYPLTIVTNELDAEKGITLFSIGAYSEAIPYLEKVPSTSPTYNAVSYMKVIAYDEVEKSNAFVQISSFNGTDLFENVVNFFKSLFGSK